MAKEIMQSHREIIQLTPLDSFLVFDRVKDVFDYPIHFHSEYELNFISQGKGLRRVVGDSLEEIDDFELVLIGSNVEHCWEQHNCYSKEIHEITVQFRQDLFHGDFLKRTIMRPIDDMLIRAAHGIVFSKSTFLAIASRIRKVSKLDGMDYFLELLSILYDLAVSRNQRLLSTSFLQNESGLKSEKLNSFYDFVQKNYSRKMTLTEVADFSNMSQVSFNRFIKKRTGKTFIEYLNDVRIGYASRWLVEKDESISEIAYSCGFNNIANFNRVFRKIKGCTPTEYREDFLGIKRVL